MTARPDPNRIGGLEWTRRTNGLLTRRERLKCWARWRQLSGTTLHRLRRDRPSATPRPGQRESVPDSRFAREVETAAAEQNPVILTHSYRSWIFGRALADVDGSDVDEELLFAGALLHDHGIEPVVPERTSRCAAPSAPPDAPGPPTSMTSGQPPGRRHHRAHHTRHHRRTRRRTGLLHPERRPGRHRRQPDMGSLRAPDRRHTCPI